MSDAGMGTRATLAEIGEALASALHDHNIGREARGWSQVSEAFTLLKKLLDDSRATDAGMGTQGERDAVRELGERFVEGSPSDTWSQGDVYVEVFSPLSKIVLALMGQVDELKEARAWLIERFSNEDDLNGVSLVTLLQRFFDWSDQAWGTAGKAEARVAALEAALEGILTCAGPVGGEQWEMLVRVARAALAGPASGVREEET